MFAPIPGTVSVAVRAQCQDLPAGVWGRLQPSGHTALRCPWTADLAVEHHTQRCTGPTKHKRGRVTRASGPMSIYIIFADTYNRALCCYHHGS